MNNPPYSRYRGNVRIYPSIISCFWKRLRFNLRPRGNQNSSDRSVHNCSCLLAEAQASPHHLVSTLGVSRLGSRSRATAAGRRLSAAHSWLIAEAGALPEDPPALAFRKHARRGDLHQREHLTTSLCCKCRGQGAIRGGCWIQTLEEMSQLLAAAHATPVAVELLEGI